MKTLTSATLPRPAAMGAYQDNNGDIWLFEPDPPSETGRWRIPGGTLAKPGNLVLELALERRGVTKFTRMAPVRLRNSK